jgi:carboxypeptidase T
MERFQGLKACLFNFSAIFVFAVALSAHADVSHTYPDIQKFMVDLVNQHPKTTQLFTLGASDSGQIIQGLKIGDGPVHNLVVGTHHGNEYGATEVTKAFAASIAADPIKGQTLFVIPVLNIGGYTELNREELDSTGTSRDPNRDYPGPCGTSGPFNLKDTAALAKFVDEQNIVASATMHTFSPAVVYPWGISTQDLSTEYDNIFKLIVQSAVTESKYPTGNNTELIYPADGTFEDYAFWKLGIWSILFELGDTHTPSDDQVADMQRTNTIGLRNMMLQAPTTRAQHHDFTGKCDVKMMMLDKHDE